MQLSILKAAALAVAFQTTSASPLGARAGGLAVIATTNTADGQVVDWVLPESQDGGKIAATPPAPPRKRGIQGKKLTIRDILGDDPGRRGPNGTVPILRSSSPIRAPKRLPTQEDNDFSSKIHAAESNHGKHWYTSTGQHVDNKGGKGTFSLFGAYVQRSADFSLLQTAVIRSKAAHAKKGTTSQTVEAGWINYPDHGKEPHLFSYFTTNGYSGDGDNIGGWNRDRKGWVQVDKDLYPGIPFKPLSTRGGNQHELEIGYHLADGNWWLWCLDRYIGYYPGSLFSQGVNAADTLADHSDIIDFYGEIFNSEEEVTTTDMGSGEWPDAGYGKAAYIHNIVYTDTKGNFQNYNGQSQLIISDAKRYNIKPSWNSASSWGSYFYLGGPGAGGKIGA